jgi:hypothetical protein
MAAVSYIFTATRVAKMLGVEEGILHEIASTLDPEDGVISVYDLNDDEPILAFTDYGIENLRTCLRDLGLAFNDAES